MPWNGRERPWYEAVEMEARMREGRNRVRRMLTIMVWMGIIAAISVMVSGCGL